MTTQRKPKSPADKMRTYRARLRAAGLRPVQVWVPDAQAFGFAEEVRRQSLLVSRHASENEVMEFIEAVSSLDDEVA